VKILFFAAFVFMCVTMVTAPAGETARSSLQSDPNGWVDLLGDGIKDWKRVPIPAGGRLNDKNCWQYDAKTGTLNCDGVGIHEMLLYNQPFKDGIFHAEWRFTKLEGKAGYNSGVYARNSTDGKIWHQAQVGSLNVGHLFGDSPLEGKTQRFRTKAVGEQRGKPAGEWNVYEITCAGPKLTLWINGAVTTVWDACPVAEGHIGLEAEGYFIEFKNLKFRPKS
jgi:hypothetical protein